MKFLANPVFSYAKLLFMPLLIKCHSTLLRVMGASWQHKILLFFVSPFSQLKSDIYPHTKSHTKRPTLYAKESGAMENKLTLATCAKVNCPG